MTTVISVNGEDGATLARRSGIRLVQDDSQALILRNQETATRDGQPGQNAPHAIRGGPAGTLAVRFSESNISQGAIRVERIEYSSTHQPPQNTEVPVGRNVLLTANGGDGECGHNGGDGQRGSDGVDGTGATKGSDATNGTNGGRGGDAGRGSNGGDGGSGGALHIIMHESNTHLLMAVSCEVRGGKGGIAGKHGKPGAGGRGGKGGEGWRWEEIVGYKAICTDSCIKNNDHASDSTALTRVRSHINASSSALMAHTGALTVTGNNVERMIAQAALRYNLMRQPRRENGACKCGGGTGSCAGCDVKPIIKTFRRAPGLEGRDGEKGTSITAPLGAGHDGEEGIVTIAVQHDDGTTQEYTSPWLLELIDFDVEDENGDGIFEPGEHIFIRRIRVRNAGGMPSPTCRIPVTLTQSSEWFEPVPAHQGGLTFLPTSVPAGDIAVTEGSIKVRIKDRSFGNGRLPAVGTRFSAKDVLKIRADMPWLDRRMPSFEFTKEIEISYPCGLMGFQHLSTIAQGAISVIQYKVQNMSNRPLGEAEAPSATRIIEVRMAIPSNFGRLLPSSDEEEVEVIQPVPCTRPKDSLTMQQQFRVLTTARSHKHFLVTFELWIESPLQDVMDETPEMVLVERNALRMQVSNTYTRTPNAKVLLITNPKTTEQESRAIQHFIRSTLRMEVDLCNVHQNGGLLGHPDNDVDEPLPITAVYREKMILILDNSFQFFDAGDRTTSQLCYPQWLTELATNRSSVLFIGCDNSHVFDAIIQSTVWPLPARLEDGINKVQNSHIFSSCDELVDSIVQEKQFGTSRVSLSAIRLKRQKWYRFGRDKPEKEAGALARHLRNRLPNERFLISPVLSNRIAGHFDPIRSSDLISERTSSHAYLVVLTGLHRQHSMSSTESKLSLLPTSETNPTSRRLDDLGKYTIIAALPCRQRIALLWKCSYTDRFIVKAITLSVVRDIFHQIEGLLDSAHKSLCPVDMEDINALEVFLKTHLNHLSDFFDEAHARRASPLPESILEVLQWIFGFTDSMKRHRRLHVLIQAILRQRPSMKNLANEQAKPSFSDMSPCGLDSVVKAIAQLTQTPGYVFTRGQKSANEVAPRTRSCKPSEWNALVHNMAERKKKVDDDMECARRELGRMLVNFSPPDAIELSTEG